MSLRGICFRTCDRAPLIKIPRYDLILLEVEWGGRPLIRDGIRPGRTDGLTDGLTEGRTDEIVRKRWGAEEERRMMTMLNSDLNDDGFA